MSTVTKPDVTQPDGALGDLLHVYCSICHPKPRAGMPALCGHPYARGDGKWYDQPPPGADVCVVCEDLVLQPCGKCGG